MTKNSDRNSDLLSPGGPCGRSARRLHYPHTHKTHERRHPHRRGGGGRRRHPGLAQNRKMHGENFFSFTFLRSKKSCITEMKKNEKQKIFWENKHTGEAKRSRKSPEGAGPEKVAAPGKLLILVYSILILFYPYLILIYSGLFLSYLFYSDLILSILCIQTITH